MDELLYFILCSVGLVYLTLRMFRLFRTLIKAYKEYGKDDEAIEPYDARPELNACCFVDVTSL